MDFDRVRRAQTATGNARGGVLSAPSARSVANWTPARYLAARAAAESGSLATAADFCAELMHDDRAGGVLEQRCEGMLALPGRFEPADVVDPVVLAEWPAVFPEAERAALLKWGTILGVGFARVETIYLGGGKFGRQVTTWHARHFDRDESGQWWVNAREGRREVVPGEGWIVFAPYGLQDATQRGLWHRLAVPYLAKVYALDDRAREGEVTPILVGSTKGLSEPQRRTFLSDLRGLARDSRVVLPEGCSLSVVDRSGAQHTIHEDTIAWADTAITITIAGQKVTTEGAPGFSAGGTQRAILHSILKHQEETFSTAVGVQALTPWIRLVTGYAGPTIYHRHDVSDPESLAAKAYAITTLAPSIETMNQSLAASGAVVDVRGLLEMAGVPLRDLPKQSAAARPTVALAPTDLVAVVSVNEARAAAGLGPLALQDGTPDPAGAQSVALYRAALEAGGASPSGPAAAGAGSSPDMGAGPLGDAAPPAAAPVDDVAAGMTTAERESFALRMSELGAKVCQHRRTQCLRCGVERVATVELDAATGQITHPPRWRAIPVPGSAPAALGALLAASAPRSSGVRLVACNALEGGAPPDRFLIFKWGENDTDHGTVTVDEAGIAEAVKRAGNRRLAIDLEHLSLDPKSPNYDPDARGSFVLATDAEGVWAADVRWTADGAERVTDRRQIYTSPAVRVDKRGRVIGVVNVALVAQPATQHIAPLIAASQATTMDLDQLVIFLRTLAGLKDDATPDEVAKAIASKYTGEKPAEEKPEPAPALEGDAPPMAAPLAASATASTGSAPAVDPGALALAEVAKLSAIVAADRDAAARDKVIAENARKFSPPLLAWARTKSADEVRAFAAVAPDLTSEVLTAPATAPAGVVALSAAELESCKRFGTDPAVVLEIKQRNAQKGG